jgi:hypothetical protein
LKGKMVMNEPYTAFVAAEGSGGDSVHVIALRQITKTLIPHAR